MSEAGKAWLLPQGRTDHKGSNLWSDWPQVMDEQWQFWELSELVPSRCQSLYSQLLQPVSWLFDKGSV